MPQRKAHDLPKVGETFNRTFNGIEYTMTIVELGKGIGYKVDNKVYRTPSAAAKPITRFAVNGWVFWHTGR